jgi:hypothetical protein
MSRYADTSASGVTRRAAQKAVATFYTTNPVSAATGSLDVSTLIQRLQGLQPILQGPTGAIVSADCCCNCEIVSSNFDSATTGIDPAPPANYPLNYYFNLYIETTCPPLSIVSVITYDGNSVTTISTPVSSERNGDNYINSIALFPISENLPIDLPSNPGALFDCTVTVTSYCNTTSSEVSYGCFLEGTPVAMADGTTKPIEQVVVGDIVLGAFGEHNPVLALHRPLLDAGKVVDINHEHKTTTHHPHISPSRTFHCTAPEILTSKTYDNYHTVILADGTTEDRIMTGVSKDRIKGLSVGTVLQTLTGPRTVDTIEDVPMPASTQVYHLVVGGSHTYHADGYAVTGWATETDFDYDAWAPK